MANMQFSWSDSLQAAVASCLPCFHGADPHSDSESDQRQRTALHDTAPPPRARPDELEGLLAYSSDQDAETLSLHSNIGKPRRKKRKPPKTIRVFGYDLFGRAPAIQLPESDDEDGSGRRPRTISSSTLDSDAAMLDTAAIQELSAARHAAALAEEQEERAEAEEAKRAKEERRRLRRERKELKKAAMARALELQANGAEEFEGFPGSGAAPPHVASLFQANSAGSGSLSVSSTQEFGPFAHGQVAHQFDPDEAEREADDGADFGGESYVRRPRRGSVPNGRASGGTGSTSDSRSRTSASNSHSNAGTDPSRLAHFLPQLQLPSPMSPGFQIPSQSLQQQQQLATSAPTQKKPRRKSKSGRSSTSKSASTSSQSASIVSPPPSAGPFAYSRKHSHSMSGMPEEDFEGVPGGDFGTPIVSVQDAEEHGESWAAVSREELPAAVFPSVGLRGIERKKSDMGVFLARRGDE